MRTLSLVSVALLLTTTLISLVNPPRKRISNGQVTVEVLLPDATNGYYRGARFDWAGVVSHLEYRKHTYFGQWNDLYDPTHHDAIMGPVDEFREPLGYEEAKAGGEFVKVGVGVLKKADDGKYSFGKKYTVTNPGTWEVTSGDDFITFEQDLRGVSGYSYRYKKTLRLARNQPVLIIDHELTNTGTKRILTNTYNHNFFMIDNEPTGPNIRTTFDFEIHGEGRGFGTLANAEGNTLTYLKTLQKGENVFTDDLRKDKSKPVKYGFAVENTKTGAGVRVKGDKPVDTMIYWSCPTTACPEPYLNVNLAPGESMDWQISYEFYDKR